MEMGRLAMLQQWGGWRCYSNGAAGNEAAADVTATGRLVMCGVTAMGRLAALQQLGVWRCHRNGAIAWRCYGNGAPDEVTATGRLVMSWHWGGW